MRKLWYIMLAFLLMCGASLVQGASPHISRFVYWTVPTINTDGSIIVDFKGVNVYYSFDGETNFVKGIDSPNFLTYVRWKRDQTPSSLPTNRLTQKKAFKWDGSFNTDLWVRATALDTHGNESEFSEAAVARIDNQNLSGTRGPTTTIIYFARESNGFSIWLTESDGTETLEGATDLIQSNWVDLGPFETYYPDLGSNQFFRAVRTILE